MQTQKESMRKRKSIVEEVIEDSESLLGNGKSGKTKWSDAMDDVLIDAFLDQHIKNNKSNGSFTSDAYKQVLAELCKHFPHTVITKEKVKNRIKQIKVKFSACYDIFKNASGINWNPISCTWVAEPEVWAALIESKPAAKDWMHKEIRNYEKLLQLYGIDRANGEKSEDPREILNEYESGHGDDVVESIDGIDFNVAENNFSLDAEFNDAEFIPSSTATSKRPVRKPKEKAVKLDPTNEGFEKMCGIIQVASERMAEVIEKSSQRVKAEDAEIFQSLQALELDARILLKCQRFLLGNDIHKRTFMSIPFNLRLEYLAMEGLLD